jgi:GNAT superfamily N-acetyltransferase
LTPELTIRPAERGDRAFIASVVPRFAEFELPPGRDRAQLTAFFGRLIDDAFDGGAEMFIAERDGRPVGFAHLHDTTDLSGAPRAHLGDLAVAEEADGTGVGRALLAFAEEWARARGHDRIGLTAVATNGRAIGIYERAGYVADTVSMSKPLGSSG